MALQQNYEIEEFGGGFIIENAYHRIESIRADKENAQIYIEIFKIGDDERQQKHFVKNIEVEIETAEIDAGEGSNIFEKAYNIVKQLPDYEGSTDV